MKKKNFADWQIQNKQHIEYIYNFIVSDLNSYELIINNKKELYEDIVYYLYKTTFHIKYIN